MGFEDRAGLHALIERLATYANTTTAYNKIVAHLNTCRRLNGETDGERFAGTVSGAQSSLRIAAPGTVRSLQRLVGTQAARPLDGHWGPRDPL
jgi:hypothetical protein